MINSGCCKDPTIMHILRCLFLWRLTLALRSKLSISQELRILPQMQYLGTIFLYFLFHAGNPGGNSRSSSNPREAGANVGEVATRLHVFSLGSAVQRLLQAGLAPATHRTYLAGKKKYLSFCMQSGTTPLPVTEEGLLHFTTFVANQVLRHTTIKGYLSAI